MSQADAFDDEWLERSLEVDHREVCLCAGLGRIGDAVCHRCGGSGDALAPSFDLVPEPTP